MDAHLPRRIARRLEAIGHRNADHLIPMIDRLVAGMGGYEPRRLPRDPLIIDDDVDHAGQRPGRVHIDPGDRSLGGGRGDQKPVGDVTGDLMLISISRRAGNLGETVDPIDPFAQHTLHAARRAYAGVISIHFVIGHAVPRNQIVSPARRPYRAKSAIIAVRSSDRASRQSACDGSAES